MSRKNSHEPTSTRDPSWKNSATPTTPCTTTRPPKPPPPDDYYNLMGQPVGKDLPTLPGIYIHHGNKILVR